MAAPKEEVAIQIHRSGVYTSAEFRSDSRVKTSVPYLRIIGTTTGYVRHMHVLYA
jgi:hypothetical protein